MNKLTKGAIAGAAGVALLLGGAGTFALWNTTVGVASGKISTGTLAFGTRANATWSDDSGATPTAFNPATQKIVPGDVVSLTQDITINATGKNLKAELAYVPSSITIPSDLAPYIDTTFTVTNVSGDATYSGTGTVLDPYIIKPTTGGTSVFTVKISYAFDPSVTGVDGQTESVDLTGAAYSLTQLP
jgi:alternate signal-mediated exported protein